MIQQQDKFIDSPHLSIKNILRPSNLRLFSRFPFLLEQIFNQSFLQYPYFLSNENIELTIPKLFNKFIYLKSNYLLVLF